MVECIHLRKKIKRENIHELNGIIYKFIHNGARATYLNVIFLLHGDRKILTYRCILNAKINKLTGKETQGEGLKL